jgi:hypothetical protein
LLKKLSRARSSEAHSNSRVYEGKCPNQSFSNSGPAVVTLVFNVGDGCGDEEWLGKCEGQED